MDWKEYEEKTREDLEQELQTYQDWYAPGFFVALSGGVDSCAALAFACNYADKQKWPRKAIVAATCVRQNAFEAEISDVNFARRIAKHFGVEFVELDISVILENTPRPSSQIITNLQAATNIALGDLIKADHIALARTFALRTLEQSMPLVSIDTGNLSEEILAQWTCGCYAGQVSIISQLFKSEVWNYAKHLGVPEYILERPKIASEIESGSAFTNYKKIDPLLFHYLIGTSHTDLAEDGYDITFAKHLEKRVELHRIRANSGTHVIEPGKKMYSPKANYAVAVRENQLVSKLHTERTNKWSLRPTTFTPSRTYPQRWLK